jgi:hypothetical protein
MWPTIRSPLELVPLGVPSMVLFSRGLFHPVWLVTSGLLRVALWRLCTMEAFKVGIRICAGT